MNDHAFAILFGLLGTFALVVYFACGFYMPDVESDGHGGIVQQHADIRRGL